MQNRSTQNVKVLDLSHHNTINSWPNIAKDGVKGVYIKLTEGTSFISSKAYDYYVAAKNAGLRVGFYHYAHCDNDPIKEVNFFLEKLNKMKVDLPHCLDLEENKGKSKAQVNAFALKWMEYLQKKTGITPILYTGYSFMGNFTKDTAKYPLWVARYSGSNRVKGFDNPGNSIIWDKWSMFQFTDQGRVKGISGNVDINEMDLSFFKSINAGVVVTGDANPPSSYQKGDSGLGVKELQQKLMRLGEKLPRFEDDGSYGSETVEAVKAFQSRNGLTVTGVADEKTLAKVSDLIKALDAPKQEELPTVTSLGDKYSFQVKATKDIGVYKYANLAENFKTLKKDTVFSVYGYTYASFAVGGGGFVQMKDVEPLSVTILTGGLNPTMENELRDFLKVLSLDAELNLHGKGNPSAEIVVSGLVLVKVRQFLDEKGWYYK